MIGLMIPTRAMDALSGARFSRCPLAGKGSPEFRDVPRHPYRPSPGIFFADGAAPRWLGVSGKGAGGSMWRGFRRKLVQLGSAVPPAGVTGRPGAPAARAPEESTNNEVPR
jgi:hypothetical protein